MNRVMPQDNLFNGGIPASPAADLTGEAAKLAAGVSSAVPKSRARLGTVSELPQIAALNNRLAVYKAAAAVHRSPAFVMDLINRGLLKAYRRGGPINKPWLTVDLTELLAVMDQETLYVPPAASTPRPRRLKAETEKLHPLAAML